MADLDAAAELQRALAVRRGVAGDDVAEDRRLSRFRQVAAEIDAGQVEAGFVGAADEIAHGGDRAIGEDRHFLPSTPTGPI